MIDRVLELLSDLRRQPDRYVQPVEVSTVHSYLSGLRTGLDAGGSNIELTYVTAASRRGWDVRDIVRHMRAESLPDDAIIQELITITADAYRRATRPIA